MVVDPGGFHRYVALRFLAVALVVAFGLRAAAKVAALPVWWCVYLAVVTASALLATDVWPALLGDPTRMMGLLGWVLIAGAWMLGASRPDVAVTRYADTLVVVGAVSSVVAIGQGLTGTVRPGGSMGNPMFLGALLCLALPVALVRWRQPRFAAASVVMVAALGLTQSRGAVLGVAVALAVVVVARGRRVVAVGLVGLGLGAVLFVPVARTTAQGRLDTWRESVAVVVDKPVLGWGPEGFRTGFAKHMSEEWVRTYGVEQIPDRAHNAVLDVAVSSGLLGAAAYVALLAATGVALWRRRNSPLEVAVAAGVLAYVVQAQFSFDTFDTAAVAWLLVGALQSSACDSESTFSRLRITGLGSSSAGDSESIFSRLRITGFGSSSAGDSESTFSRLRITGSGSSSAGDSQSTFSRLRITGSGSSSAGDSESTFSRLRITGLVGAGVAVLALCGFGSDRLISFASGRPPATAFDRLALAARLWPHSSDAGSLAARVAALDGDGPLHGRAAEVVEGWSDPYVELSYAMSLGFSERGELIPRLRAAMPNHPGVYELVAEANLVDNPPSACAAWDKAISLSHGAHLRQLRHDRHFFCRTR